MMSYLSGDPRLDLYDATHNTYSRIVQELQASQETRYLGFLESSTTRQDFSDPASSFEADEYILDGIERFNENVYALAVDLFKGGAPYARQTDLMLPDIIANSEWRRKHLIALSQDGPPVLLHNSYFSSVLSDAGDLHFLLATNRGEVLGLSRAQSVIRTLGSLTARQVDTEEFL